MSGGWCPDIYSILLQLEVEKSETEKHQQEPVQKNVTKKDSQKLLIKPHHVIASDCKSPLRKHPALNTEGGKRVADPGSQDQAAESEFSRVYNQLRRDKQELVM